MELTGKRRVRRDQTVKGHNARRGHFTWKREKWEKAGSGASVFTSQIFWAACAGCSPPYLTFLSISSSSLPLPTGGRKKEVALVPYASSHFWVPDLTALVYLLALL